MFRLSLLMFCAFVIFSTVSTAIAEVKDKTVRAWIARGFIGAECKPASIEEDLNNSRSVDDLKLAFEFLKFTCRDNKLSLDLNLAAAENYVFVRWAASRTGDTGMKVLPKGYYALKKATDAIGIRNILKTSKEPVSPPHPEVLRWGELGVEHGLRDFKKRTGNKPSLKSTSLKLAWEILSGVYGR
jgi:hypothetical protein